MASASRCRFDEWLWCWPIRALKCPLPKRVRSCRRGIVVRTVSPTGVIWRALPCPLHPTAAAGGETDERRYCRAVSTKLLPGLTKRDRHPWISAHRRGNLGSGPTLFALCDKPDTAKAAWRTGSLKHYLQNQGKALFIFAVWTRLAHEYWDNNETLQP